MDFIFDIDGTLANIDHRVHHVRNKPKNWPAFDKGIPLDEPNHDIIFLNNILNMIPVTRIAVVSGRSDRQREATVDWLNKHGVKYDALFMRRDKDSRADDIVKEEILVSMYLSGWNPYMVFDDRDRVVKMWRRHGIRTLQVQEGDF